MRHDDGAPQGSRSPAARLALVVDDIEDNRFLYRIGFERAGWRVQDAADGAKAMAMIALDPPAFVVMDLDMPCMDGWEATRRIKSSTATNGIIVIVVTGTVTDDDLARAWAAGADEVCTKPCTPTTLLRHAARLLAPPFIA